MKFGDIIDQVYATRIDFKYNQKTGSYSIIRSNNDPSKVLYKDGVFRVTSLEEIKKQLANLLRN
jgi:hypothetical protein